MIDRRRAQLLLGETIREGGILVFQKEGPGELIVVLMVSIGLLLLTLGIIIESMDQTGSRTP